MVVVLLNPHSHVVQQTDEVLYVKDIGDVGDVHLLVGEQTGADDLQSLIFGSLGDDGALEWVTTFDDK